MLRLSRCIAAATLVAACGSSAPATEPVTGDLPIQLRTAPADLGCDAIGVPYRVVTFRIDPAAADHVTAISNKGNVLRTFWSAGFRGGSADENVVRDPTGAVVAVDGEVLLIPQGAWPRLRGHFVCPAPDALYVLSPEPT